VTVWDGSPFVEWSEDAVTLRLRSWMANSGDWKWVIRMLVGVARATAPLGGRGRLTVHSESYTPPFGCEVEVGGGVSTMKELEGEALRAAGKRPEIQEMRAAMLPAGLSLLDMMKQRR
jgi:hypothetical protein